MILSGWSGYLFLHKRVFKISCRNESLFYCPGAYPPYQIKMTSCLVVGSGSPGSAERLLPDHCPCGLIVDIEVSSSIPEGTAGLYHSVFVVAEDRSCKSVWRSIIISLKGFCIFIIIIDKDRHHRAEDLFLHCDKMRIRDNNYS